MTRPDSGQHCWHTPEVIETFHNGWESSTRVICCWCGAMGYRVTRRIGMDSVDGHGPHHQEVREVTRIDIRHGGEECPS